MKRVLLLVGIVAIFLMGMSVPSQAYVEWSDGGWAEANTDCTNQGTISNRIRYEIKTAQATNWRIWMYEYRTGQWLKGAWQRTGHGQTLVAGFLTPEDGFRGWYTTWIQFGRGTDGAYWGNEFDPVSESHCYL